MFSKGGNDKCRHLEGGGVGGGAGRKKPRKGLCVFGRIIRCVMGKGGRGRGAKSIRLTHNT